MLPVLNTRKFPGFLDEFLGSDLFDDFNTKRKGFLPSVNIVEGNDDFRIEVAAPGLDKKDFKIDLDNDMLTIYSEKEEKNENKNEKMVRREFSYASFRRSFSLPESIDRDKIKASYKDGILNVHIPKKEEAKIKAPRKIEIS
ncbi:MAG: Hsp20/alpha crystallin family protein [Bacteroidota bacterium]